MSNDFIVVVGSMLSYDAPELLEEIKNSKIALVSVMEDIDLMDSVDLFSRYEAGSEEGVVAILAKEFLKDADLPKEIRDYFNDLDEGYISAETNIGEEEVEELYTRIQNASKPLIIFGKDIFKSKIGEYLKIYKSYKKV